MLAVSIVFHEKDMIPSKKSLLLLLLLLITLSFWKIRSYNIKSYQYNSLVDLNNIPATIGDWKSTDTTLKEGVLSKLGVDQYKMRSYVKGEGNQIWLYVGYYRSQAQGETIHSPQHCYPGGGWNPVHISVEAIPIPSSGKVINVRKFIVGKDDEREVVYYWYDERGRVVANEYVSKFYLIYDSLTKGRNDGALVRFSGRSGVDTQATLNTMKEFIVLSYPTIDRTLHPDHH
jgi:EpsI family protein